MTPAEDHEVKDETMEWDDIESDGKTTVGGEEGQEQIEEEEEEDGTGSQYQTETETETTETETDDDGACKSKR